MKKITITGFLLSLLFSLGVLAQAPVSPPQGHSDRTEKVEPFNIIDNIYYVGETVQEASYLITGSEGHIIIDTGYDVTVPIIIENIKKLGFDIEDVKLIIGTHAHSDHVEGHTRMKEMTGATILASAPDVATIESGGGTDFRDGDWRPAKVDRVVADGEVIRLGDIAMTANYTPGHTRGCMSFSMNAVEEGQNYNVLLLGGVRVAARPVFGHPKYPKMASDFASTFEKLQKMPVDIFLGGHGYWYGLGDKMRRSKAGEGFRAFIDPDGFKKAVDGWQQQFVDQLVKEGMELVNK
ncbi:MAG: metallo-beta-lactamase class B [Gammaproteobacteria bacterium]|jgi:metallo-beta-lactamase class B